MSGTLISYFPSPPLERPRLLLRMTGATRLSVHQPLALGATQQHRSPFSVVLAKLRAVIVLEVGSGQIPMQMGFRDMVELAIHRALEEREV